MVDTNIGATTTTNMTNTVTDFSVDTATTDGADGETEFEYQNQNWPIWYGYYIKIPEINSAINAKARWTVGKGYTSDPTTKFILDNIRGFGKDTFDTILENMIRTYIIAGDSFAEIIRDKEGNLINLKSLDPQSIKIIANKKGIIKRYEQTAKVGRKSAHIKFKPDEIFHLSRNRVADEIHGQSIIPAVIDIIDSRNEAMKDMRKLMHRHVKPVINFKVDTDNTARIKEFKAEMDKAFENTENIVTPLGTVEHEIIAVPTNATLNPLPWINQLTQTFYQVIGVPQIIVGGAQEITEATAKIVYLAWEQTVEEDQLYIEEECGQQLGIGIELEFPASLENELLSDKAKSETTQASTPEDTNVKGVGLNAA